ncbi:hypothetical protein A4D02_12190 [Niastella koreensis]|uniref:Delta-60 repeat-containing protein n=2 Tax=Niastella koreensis TaxID=354356 RepID=G8TI92_NIAKG|nr:T9SS type A sorting domain-containing protein [Niastella koreensis]AEW00709.1 Delta-60 repeat-containing protein [Niastella koreensis GR20-10]OQP42335.1 hypothetical protein A4D02_12190 [Niastella koreensis]
MKQFTSTLTMALLCLCANAQVGSIDPTFNSSGTPGYVTNSVVGTNDYAAGITTYPDGRILVVSYVDNEAFTVTRYLANGTVDGTFATGGTFSQRRNAGDNAPSYAIKLLSDNSILLAGSDYPTSKNFALLKLQPNGTPDLTFGSSGDGWVETDIAGHDEAYAIATQTDGSIVLAGYSTSTVGTKDFAVVRYSSAGIIDAGFGTGGKVFTHIAGNDVAQSIAIQPDGKIVVGGTSDADGTDPNFTVIRYNSDGSLDAAGFGTGGVATFDLATRGTAGSKDFGYSLALQSDGKILLAGKSTGVALSGGDMAVIRLTTAGALDATFNPSGAIPGISTVNNGGAANNDDGANAIALQNDGKMVLAGSTDGTPSPTFGLLVARLKADGTLDATFGTGGLTVSDITSTGNELGNVMTLYSTRIYVAGSTGSPKDNLIVAYQNDAVSLPLVLSQFYAQKQTSKVVLQWQTSSEEAVKQFVIERSTDGKTYKAIGQVAASGTSSLTKNYSFADVSPYMSASNYYRLNMQDIDGSVKYSKILIIKFDGQLTTSMSVFPNPTRDLLQVQLPDGMNGQVALQVFDLNGRLMKFSNLASDGSALNTTVDVSTLVKGIYILKAQAGNVTLTSHFIKK